jgi:hypothetical protein
MQTHAWMMFLLTALGTGSPALAQTHPQDAIDRNLQAREAREREFHVRLQEDAVPAPRPVVPGQTGLQIYVPTTPGSEILRRDVPRRPASVPQVAPDKSVVSGEVQLRDSQTRRQMELQTQTSGRPEPERQQILQIQQLGFDRETSSQDLGSRIMRDSSRALGTPR